MPERGLLKSIWESLSRIGDRVMYADLRQQIVEQEPPSIMTIEMLHRNIEEQNNASDSTDFLDEIRNDCLSRVKVYGRIIESSEPMDTTPYQHTSLRDETGTIKLYIQYGDDTELGIESKLSRLASLRAGDDVVVVGLPLPEPVKAHHPYVTGVQEASQAGLYISNLLPMTYAILLKRANQTYSYEVKATNEVWEDWVVRLGRRYTAWGFNNALHDFSSHLSKSD